LGCGIHCGHFFDSATVFGVLPNYLFINHISSKNNSLFLYFRNIKNMFKYYGKKIGKYAFKLIGGKYIDKASSWIFLTALTFWGPGPIVALIGYEGLIAITAVTQSGVIRYAGDKIVSKLIITK